MVWIRMYTIVIIFSADDSYHTVCIGHSQQKAW